MAEIPPWKNRIINKHQSGFRRAKSTNDHLFRLSQSIMEGFNRGEHVVADFLDVEKAFDNVWHNGLRHKMFQLDLPTKMTFSLNIHFAAKFLQQDLLNLAIWCAKWRIKLVFIFSRSILAS